ncbi:MAG: hypothetical protein NTW21_15210 [Verrucomicrobia bacterium]|nr:hypothetical protein [Verrucomicrobiota bacterium]
MSALITLVVAMIAFRFMPHPENVAPIGAFALMGGLFLSKRLALAVPVLALVLSDLVLNAQMGYAVFHAPRLVDYSAFLAIGMVGVAIRNRGWKMQFGSAVAVPFFFYAVSNFGVWLTGLSLSGQPYAKTLTGLVECYVAGLPFLRGSMFGDWGFMALFAAVMALAAVGSRTERAAVTSGN